MVSRVATTKLSTRWSEGNEGGGGEERGDEIELKQINGRAKRRLGIPI